MGKTARKTVPQQPASNHVHRLRNNIGKNKFVSVSTLHKPSKTRKAGPRALQHTIHGSLPGGKKSILHEAILQHGKAVVILKKANLSSANKERNPTEVNVKKKKERTRPSKKEALSESVPLQDDPNPSSECVWEVNPSSSDVEPKRTAKTTSKFQKKAPTLETSFKMGKALIHNTPSITVVDLGFGFRSNLLQTVSLAPTEKSLGKRSNSKKPVLRSHYNSDETDTSHLGTRSLFTPLMNDVMPGNNLKNPMTEERPVQSVFIVDLGNKYTRNGNANVDSSKSSVTLEDSSKNKLKKRKLSGVTSDEQLKQDHGGEQAPAEDLESVTPKKVAVKCKRKKRTSSGKAVVKGSVETEREVDFPSDEVDKEVTSSTPMQETVKRKTKKKQKVSKVRPAKEAEKRCEEEALKMEQDVSHEDNTAHGQDEVMQSGSNLNEIKDKIDDINYQNHSDVTKSSLEATLSGPVLSETMEDVKESADHSRSPSGSPIDVREKDDEASPTDVAGEQGVLGASSFSSEAKTESSYRIMQLKHSDQCLVLLPHPSKFSFHGRVLLRSIHGSATIMGFPITASTDHKFYPLYSPSSSCALCIETSSQSLETPGKSSQGVRRTLVESLNAFLSAEGEEDAAEDLQGLTVALVFKKTPVDHTVEYVEHFPGFGNLFSSPETKESTEQQASTSNLTVAAAVGFQPTTPNTPGTVFDALPGYHTVTQTIKRWLHSTDVMPVVLVCGWKNTGKSTLSRYLSNSLIPGTGSVCYLECDMAQTEFTPPGMLSLQHITQPLLGPPFTHSREPEKMCFYGDVNVRGDPESYLQMIKYLFQYYKTRHMDKPLIINTMGWMQGLGLQLLIDIVHITRPTHIVQLWSCIQPRVIQRLTPRLLEQMAGWWHQPDEGNDGIDEDGARALFPEILEVDVATVGDQGGTKYKASDHRVMALLASMSDLQPSPLPSAPVALSCLTPLVLPWRCVAVHVTNAHVPPRQVMYALNGSIVGLCRSDPAEMLFVTEDLPRVFDSTPVCQCLGLGIIRGIDPVQKVFYILTGVSQDALQQVNTLLKGSLTLPQPLLTQGHRVADVPYVSREFSSVIIGSAAIKVRRNIKQRGR